MLPPRALLAQLIRALTLVFAAVFIMPSSAFSQGIPQTIVFNNPGDTETLTTSGVAIFTSSGLPATFESLTPTVCTTDGLTFTTHVRGTCTLVARQAGNEIYLPAPEVVQSLTVRRQQSTIVWTFPPTSSYPYRDVPLTAYASPGFRPLTYTSETPAVCPLSHPAQLRTERKGTCTVTARQPGDEVFEPAPTDETRSFQVLGWPQTISFTNPGSQLLGSGPVPLTVFTTIGESTSQGLPVALSSTTPTVCTTSERTAVLLAIGTCTIVAKQAGNDDIYDAAADVEQSFAVILGTPDPPIGVVAHVNGNFVSLSWSSAPTGAVPEAYLVEVGDGPGRTTITSALTPLLGDTGLLPLGEYYMRVRAQNGAGLSAPSEDVWLRVTGTNPVALPPLAPSAVVDGTTVAFRWTAATGGAPPESFLVQVRTNPLGGDLAAIALPADTTVFTVPNVPPGTYVLQVRAITDAGPSPPSPAIWLRVGPAPSCGAAPNAPLMLTPVVSDSSVALSWLPPVDGSAESFVVQAGTQAGQSDLAAVAVGAIGGVGTNVGAGQYFVRAVSASQCGLSAPTVEQTITVGGPMPDAPTGLAATSGPGGVTFTWTPPAGVAATHYVVEAGATSGTTLIKFPVGSTPTLTIPGVPSGLTFVARVRAANASGIGPASAEIVVTVP